MTVEGKKCPVEQREDESLETGRVEGGNERRKETGVGVNRKFVKNVYRERMLCFCFCPLVW